MDITNKKASIVILSGEKNIKYDNIIIVEEHKYQLVFNVYSDNQFKDIKTTYLLSSAVPYIIKFKNTHEIQSCCDCKFSIEE